MKNDRGLQAKIVWFALFFSGFIYSGLIGQLKGWNYFDIKVEYFLSMPTQSMVLNIIALLALIGSQVIPTLIGRISNKSENATPNLFTLLVIRWALIEICVIMGFTLSFLIGRNLIFPYAFIFASAMVRAYPSITYLQDLEDKIR